MSVIFGSNRVEMSTKFDRKTVSECGGYEGTLDKFFELYPPQC